MRATFVTFIILAKKAIYNKLIKLESRLSQLLINKIAIRRIVINAI